MRKLGLTFMGALALWCGSAVALGAGGDPTGTASISRPTPEAFDLNTAFIRWAPGAASDMRDLALLLAGAEVVSGSSDGAVTQIRAENLDAAMAALADTGPNVVAAVQSAREFIKAELGVTGFEFVSVDIPARDAEVNIPLEIEGATELLVLERRSLRAPGFKVIVDHGNGVLEEVPAPPVMTYRGALEGISESTVAASLHSGLFATIYVDGPFPREWAVQPLAKVYDGAPADAHVIYARSQVLDHDIQAFCAGAISHAEMGPGPVPGGNAQEAHLPSGSSRVMKLCEIAYDADFEFYQKNSSSIPTTVADIEAVQNGVTVIYERDCEVTFAITTVIVRSNSSDPYTSSVADTLLTQFRNHWQNNQQSVPRDIAHLMTGRNINGGTIGIAWLSAVCTSNGYGLSESRFSGNLNMRVALTAHEIGHNFSANHCDGNGDCHIMCSGINGCNGIGNPPYFGNQEKTTIRNYGQNRPCLSNAANSPPTVNIISPSDGATYNQGFTVTFVGSASDSQDNAITLTNSIVWSSSLQGTIGNGPVFSRTDLVPGTHVITASVTDSGGLNDTDTRTITVQSGTSPPDAPASPAAEESPFGVVLLTWTDMSNNETSFTIQRQQFNGSVWTGTVTLPPIPANSTSFNDTPGEGSWRYRIRADNGAGSSAYSSYTVARPISATGIAGSVTGSTVNLSWSDNSLFESAFEVQRQQYVGSTWVNTAIVANPPANSTTYSESPGSGQWRYRVRSYAPGRFSTYTSWVVLNVP